MFNRLRIYCVLSFLFIYVNLISQEKEFLTYSAALAWARSTEQSLEQAVPVFDQSIKKAREAGYLDTVALLTHYKAVKYYRVDIDSALAINAKAIALRIQQEDREGASRSYYNQGLFYNAKGEPDGVKESFEAILNLAYSKDNPMFVSSSYRLSLAERDRGDYERALYYLDIAFQPLQKDPEKTRRDSTNLGLLHHAYSTIYNQMGDSLLSLRAKEHLREEIELYQTLGLDNRLAAAYFEMGSAFENLHQYDSAIYFFEEAKRAYAILEDEEMVNDAQNNLSLPLRKLGRYAEALNALQNSLRQHQATVGLEPHPAKARLYDNLGEVYLAKGEINPAIFHFQQAIANVVPFPGADGIEANPSREAVEDLVDKEDLLTYLRDKARAWQAYYQQEQEESHLQQALQTLLLADYVVDLMRREHLDAESKLFWRKKVHPIYEEGLAICYALGDAEQAFYFMEKSKAVLLLDALMEMDTRKWIDPALADQELSLSEALIQARQDLQAQPDDPGIRKKILDAQNQLQAIRKDIQAQYPEYYDLRYKTAQVSREAFLAQLPKGAATIQFFSGENYTYILTLAPEQAKLHQVDSRVLKPLIFDYLSYFEGASTILQHPEAYQQSGFLLYRTLMAPALAALQSKRLILMPDGLLHNLPFEALITKEEQMGSISAWNYFQQSNTISYAYSATILSKQLQTNPGEARQRTEILALAPFAEEGDESWGVLAYSDDEVNGIAALGLGGRFESGIDASYELFQKRAADFGILHLSTHASVNAKEGEPFIDFRDERLYLRDLYRLQLPAELVVLSACQTNLGELKRGEGVMSLNRGFTYAGAKSLISSLWSVNDRATAKIFGEFYRQLKGGKSKAEALHQAKLAYLESTDLPDEEKSPYYWAGFIHYGDDSTLELRQETFSRTLMLSLAACALIAGLLVGRFIQKSNGN
ncbi:MAG: CHAT domain-containing protein [Saprospiraceae bacterium]|nr:CHAT domain-containing protein [Saprospiraceae bacterium]